jgi:Rubisco Assembly chaperone C-terminal domain
MLSTQVLQWVDQQIGNWACCSGMQAVRSVPAVGGNGLFQAIQLPPKGGQAIVLPRWNVIALARRPAALFVDNASEVPAIVSSFPNIKVRESCVVSAVRLQAVRVLVQGRQ